MSCFPEERIIQAPCGDLEIAVTCPSTSPPDGTSPWAVICHPHPLHGGAMTNKVVYMISRSFNALGVATVRFNFRGVGKSAGEFDNGEGECGDLRAVVDWVNQMYQPSELWLGGFSFGSYVALRSHRDLHASRLLLVAPAVERFDFNALSVSEIPTLIVQGGQDDVVSPDAVIEWAEAQENRPKFEWFQEADHFFHGKLNELRETIITHWQAPQSKA